MSGLEIVGAISGIANLAAIVFKVSKSLYDVGNSLSSASSDIIDLAQDLETFSEELNLLASLFNGWNKRYSLRIHNLVTKIIGDCCTICGKIDKILTKLQRGGMRAKLQWVFKEKEILRLLARLRDLKLSLMGMLGMLGALKADHLMDSMGVTAPSLLRHQSESYESKRETRGYLTVEGNRSHSCIILKSQDLKPTALALGADGIQTLSCSIVPVTFEGSYSQALPPSVDNDLPAPLVSLPRYGIVAQNGDAMASYQSFHSALSSFRQSINIDSMYQSERTGPQVVDISKVDYSAGDLTLLLRLLPSTSCEDRAPLVPQPPTIRHFSHFHAVHTKPVRATNDASPRTNLQVSIRSQIRVQVLSTRQLEHVWWKAFDELQRSDCDRIGQISQSWTRNISVCRRNSPSHRPEPTDGEICYSARKRFLLPIFQEISLNRSTANVHASFLRIRDIYDMVRNSLKFEIGAVVWCFVPEIVYAIFHQLHPPQQLVILSQLAGVITLVARYNVMESIYQNWPDMTLAAEYETALVELCKKVLAYLNGTMRSIKMGTIGTDISSYVVLLQLESIEDADRRCRAFKTTIVSDVPRRKLKRTAKEMEEGVIDYPRVEVS